MLRTEKLRPREVVGGRMGAAGSREMAGVRLLESPRCPLPCRCWKGRDPGSPRPAEPAARDMTVTGGGWVALLIAPTQGV